jgi:DNA (cytosine-5)-methyltransferase 1
MPTFAEFFAGIGLVRMGLERHGWEVVFANDNSSQKYEMYRNQFPDTENHFLLDDINNVEAIQIPDITMATASFPCTDLSLAGSRAGLNGRNSATFWRFIQILEAMGERKPPIVLLENVVGFLTSHEGNDFRLTLEALNSLGYGVDCLIVDAVHFVPQSRPRLFVIGTLNTPNYPQIPLYANDARPKDLTKFIMKHPEIRWCVRDLPSFPQRERTLSSVLDDLPDNAPEWWSVERAEYLLHQMSTRHRLVADYLINGDTWSYGTVFRRMRNGMSTAELRVDGIAGCLRTPRGGSAKQILFKAGYGRYSARLLTPRECARLMGADNYNITVPRDQALFGFGDAVCVTAIEWIAQHYLARVLREIHEARQALLYA